MNYKILKADTPERLMIAVNALFGNGWRVQGGVSVGIDNYGNTIFAQALIKQQA